MFHRDLAMEAAVVFVDELSQACEKIQIAGSLRREARDVKDIEFVALPITTVEYNLDLFGEVVGTRQVSELEGLLMARLDPDADWDWELDPDLPRNGPRYKRLRHKPTGICCDLFLTTSRGWGGAMVIRTGPAAFSRALMRLARRQGKHVADGYLLHNHPKHGSQACEKGADCWRITNTSTERGFLDALGLPWIRPSERSEAWLWRHLKN